MKLNPATGLIVALLVAAGQAGEAQAQAPEPRQQPAAGDDSEIIVTATRRETTLQDTPMAISAFTGKAIEDAGVANLSDVLQFAPGVTFQSTGNTRSDIFIRNLGAQGGLAAFTGASIGYYIDEVPFSNVQRASLPDVRTWDIERIEVLRGPQGTLYGAQSLGGTVRILTNDPDNSDFQAKGDFSISSTSGGKESHAAKAMVNLPLVDNRLSLRLAATTEDIGGWLDSVNAAATPPSITQDINEFQAQTVRAKLRYTPSDRINAVLTFAHAETNELGANVSDDAGKTFFGVDFILDSDVTSNLYSGKVEVDFDAFSLVSSTSYYNWTLGQVSTSPPGFFITDEEIKNFNQEVRLVSKDTGGRFNWILGGLYADNESYRETAIPFFFLRGADTRTTKSFAVYGEATYGFSDAVEVTAGLRYYQEDQSIDEVNRITSTVFPTRTDQFDDISPKLSLVWRPQDDQLYYATVSKGFRSGTANTSGNITNVRLFSGITAPALLEPDVVWNYEVGTKQTFLDGRLQVDAAAYYLKYERIQQLLTFITGLSAALFNTGEIEGKGLELGSTFRISDTLSGSFNANWNETQYQTTDPLGVFRAGEQLQFTPKYSMSGGLNYSRPLSGDWRAIASATAELVGKRYGVLTAAIPGVGAAGAPLIGEQSLRVNLQAGVQDDDWSFVIFADNVNDDFSRQVAAQGLSSVRWTRYTPRTVGLAVRVNY